MNVSNREYKTHDMFTFVRVFVSVCVHVYCLSQSINGSYEVLGHAELTHLKVALRSLTQHDVNG